VGKYPKLSEPGACLILGVPRSTMRYQEVPQADETPLRHGVLEVANLYGRYGHRTVFDLLSAAGWRRSEALVRRIWAEEGLKVPAKQPPPGRLWLHGGSCVRFAPRGAEPCLEPRLCSGAYLLSLAEALAQVPCAGPHR